MRSEFYLSVFAIVIAFSALVVSLWQLNETREYNRLSVRPRLSIVPYLEGPDGRNGLYIENSGLGPAVINSFKVETPKGIYSGLVRNQWNEILNVNEIDGFCFSKGWPDLGSTLKAGERAVLLEVNKTKPDGCYIKALELFKKDSIILKVGYKSMYDEPFHVERNTRLASNELDLISSMLGRYLQ